MGVKHSVFVEREGGEQVLAQGLLGIGNKMLLQVPVPSSSFTPRSSSS